MLHCFDSLSCAWRCSSSSFFPPPLLPCSSNLPGRGSRCVFLSCGLGDQYSRGPFSTSPAHGVGDARRFASSSVSESAARIPATLAGQRLIAVAARAVGAHLARRGLLVWSWLWDSRLLVVIVGLDLNGFDLTDIRPDPFGAETSHASSYTAWVFDCMNGAGA